MLYETLSEWDDIIIHINMLHLRIKERNTKGKLQESI